MSPLTFEQSLLMLEGTGPVLSVAHEVSDILRDFDIRGAIIGGVAVSLHGYLRTTVDVDVYVEDDGRALADRLVATGYVYEPSTKVFMKSGVPVHLVTRAQLESPPKLFEEVRSMRTVSLADLVNMKLRSGTRSILRAKDIGDVIGLIRARQLRSDFAAQIDKDLRSEFRKLVRAIEKE